MSQKIEARSSLENSLRAPSKAETILSEHMYLCGALMVAFVFALPHIIGTIFEVLLYA